MVKADIKEYSEFPLFGGPLHRLGVRLRLVRPGGNSILLGLALGMSVWLILLILAAVQGNLSRFFSVNVFAGHVRFLIAIPLFFTCETLIAPRMSDLVNYLLHAEIVTGKEKTGLDAAIGTIRRLRDSSWPEGIFFLLVMALPFMGFSGFLPGQSDDVNGLIEQAGKLTLVNTVYIGFALPLFRFLFLRWLWQLGLWVYFLYRLNKLRLRLITIHLDGTGG